MKIKIYVSILIILLILVSIIILFSKNIGKKYIHLEECYRVVEECVVFDTQHKPIYIAYKDCSVPPRRVEIRDYIFVEK